MHVLGPVATKTRPNLIYRSLLIHTTRRYVGNIDITSLCTSLSQVLMYYCDKAESFLRSQVLTSYTFKKKGREANIILMLVRGRGGNGVPRQCNRVQNLIIPHNNPLTGPEGLWLSKNPRKFVRGIYLAHRNSLFLRQKNWHAWRKAWFLLPPFHDVKKTLINQS